MNEEEKKAVEKIKEIIECFYIFPNPISIELKDCDCSTLEIALKLIEKLQKENEKLKNKLLDILEGQKVIKEETPQYIKENYVLVEKIKKELKELKEEYMNIQEIKKEKGDFGEEKSKIQTVLLYKIEALQELLKESEE